MKRRSRPCSIAIARCAANTTAPCSRFTWPGRSALSTGAAARKRSPPGRLLPRKRSFAPSAAPRCPASSTTCSVFMPAGALEGELGIRPQIHLFVGSKSPGHEIADGLPNTRTIRPNGTAGLPAPTCAAPRCRRRHLRLRPGALRARGPPFRMHHCHCGRCPRARRCPRHQRDLQDRCLAIHAGEKLVADFSLPGAEFFGTSFCSGCGGAVPRLPWRAAPPWFRSAHSTRTRNPSARPPVRVVQGAVARHP